MKSPFLLIFCLFASFPGTLAQTTGPPSQYFCSDSCVTDFADVAQFKTNGSTCEFTCAAGGSIYKPCTTTTSTTTSTSTTTTSTTTTTTTPSTTTAPPVILDRCGPIVRDGGVQQANQCVKIDKGATCNTDESLPVCQCSIGYNGTTCGITAQQLKDLEQLVGGPEVVQKLIDTMIESKGSGGAATIISNLPSLLSFLTDAERIGMSYKASEVIAWATYEGKSLDVNTDFIRVTDPSLGNCFTFNHHNSSFLYKIRKIGTGGGLRVELDAMPNEYAPWTDVVGMTVYVHPIGQELNVESNKYASVAGSADQLVMQRATMQKLGKKCAKDTSAAQSFYMDGRYTVDGCLRACYQDSVNKECGCMDASYDRKEGVSSCKFGKLPCISAMALTRGDPVHWPECHCPQPCYEETFDYVVSRASHLRIDNANLTHRRSEVILYFDSFQTAVSHEEYKMSLSQFFGNVGGMAGLLLGINVAFIVEVVLLIVMLTCCGCGSPSHPEKTVKAA